MVVAAALAGGIYRRAAHGMLHHVKWLMQGLLHPVVGDGIEGKLLASLLTFRPELAEHALALLFPAAAIGVAPLTILVGTTILGA